jgi:hypothetical protein
MMYTNWRKSSYSLSNGNCVEVGAGQGMVAVRDSRDPEGPTVGVSPRAWIEFTEQVKRATSPNQSSLRHRAGDRGLALTRPAQAGPGLTGRALVTRT